MQTNSENDESNNANVSRAIKRINRDLVELANNPCLGIGIAQLNPDDFFTFVVNIMVLNGIYSGILFQLEMTVPKTYPVNPPRMRIMPGQPFNHMYHHHVFEDYNGYKKFCIDLLDNQFMSTTLAGTGWSPAYSFKSIFLQIQNFLSDPDMQKDHLPTSTEVNFLKREMEKYSCEFKLENGEVIKHTYQNPFPKIHQEIDNKNYENDDGDKSKTNKNNLLMEKLTCYLTRNNPSNYDKICLGYPFMIRRDHKNRLEPNPIPEVLSYEGYLADLSNNPIKLERFFRTSLKTANLKEYNFWCPIYLNENHFQINKQVILNSLSTMLYGPLGKKEYDFHPDMLIQVVPVLLNKMTIYILTGKTHMSIAAMEVYCHFLVLMKRLLKEFPKIQKELDDKFEKVTSEESTFHDFHKDIFLDLGQYVVLMFFSKHKPKNYKLFMVNLMREHFARNIQWKLFSPHNFEKDNLNYLKVFKADPNLKKLDYSRLPVPIGFFVNDKGCIVRCKQNEKEKLSKVKENRLEDKASSFLEKLKFKFEMFFWDLYSIENVDQFKFSADFFKKPPTEVLNDFELKTEWANCSKLYDNYDKTCNEYKVHTKAIYSENIFYKSFDVHRLRPLTQEYPLLVQNLEFHWRFNKLIILEACSETTKQYILKEVFQANSFPIVFKILAASKFINDECYEKLVSNYSVVDENEAVEFVYKMRETYKNLKSYTDLMKILDIPEFFNSSGRQQTFTEYDSFLQSIIDASDQRYIYYPIQYCVRNYFESKYYSHLNSSLYFPNNQKDFVYQGDNNNYSKCKNDDLYFLAEIEEKEKCKKVTASVNNKTTTKSNPEEKNDSNNSNSSSTESNKGTGNTTIIKTIPGLPGYKKIVNITQTENVAKAIEKKGSKK